MKKTAAAVLFALALPVSVFASTIAIIDSGSDYQHKDLAAQYGINTKEIAGNKIDDDKNGLKDDVYGYNFAESNDMVIDYTYQKRLDPIMPDIQKLFEIQVRYLDKSASPEDIAWLKAKKGDEAFMKELQVFGNYAHGTHVAGITGGHSTTIDPNNHPFAIKIIPTEVKLPFSVQFANSPEFRSIANASLPSGQGIPVAMREMLFEGGLMLLTKFQTKIFTKVGNYVNARGADVANGSFGTGFENGKMIVEMLYNLVFKENERDPKKVEEFTHFFMNQLIMKSRAMLTLAPNTLFVFAAGNDGSNNDVYPVSPANIGGDNAISVAATLRNRELASFSNYGNKVDVAAPGVGILSLYPGGIHGLMSGTSQAAPYVAGVAGSMKNENPNLKPVELKAILMGTVDTKAWLIGKVRSGGLVNPMRAVEAARLSKSMTVYQAITAAMGRVRDQVISEVPSNSTPGGIGDIGLVPLVSPIN